MKIFIKNLTEYTFYTNKKMIDCMIANNEKLSERAIELMSHTLRAHEIWLNRLRKNDISLKVWENISLNRLSELNKDLYEQTIEIINDKEFDANIAYKNSKGEEFVNKVIDILFHINNHSNYHRGQLNTEFKKSGIEPVLTDYIFYKR